MNPEWNHDDAALDALIRTATEGVQPSPTFLARLDRELVLHPRPAERSPLALTFRRSVLAAAAVMALLFTGWQLQSFTSSDRAPMTGTSRQQPSISTESAPNAVHVSFESERDAIVVREPSTDPNVTILWIHPVTSAHATAPTIDINRTPEEGNDS